MKVKIVSSTFVKGALVEKGKIFDGDEPTCKALIASKKAVIYTGEDEKKDSEKKDSEKKDPEKKDSEKKDSEKKDPEKKDPDKKPGK